MLGWLGFQRIFLGIGLGGRPIVLLALLLVVTGVQLVTLGLLGEMLARTYHESQGKPIYVVSDDWPAQQERAEAPGMRVVSGL